ncbi:hypothetical protein JTE90_011783 [Oedothorax gibbosus]|uniref:Uncharacterized protein n=1 Tax=Oedothorax gibbosus TaxID=931172 RepID=A0AAV6VR39_9ARAC|nr:hypothetical protein JTE90_011783 [Oedothorax gibbosus]
MNYLRMYGGYLPRVLTRFGRTYGSLSHEVMVEKPMVAARLVTLEPKNKTETDSVTRNARPQCYNNGFFNTEEEKSAFLNFIGDSVVTSLDFNQHPYDTSEDVMEDPIPKPLPIVDFSKEKKRCKNGMWMRCDFKKKNFLRMKNFRNRPFK